MSRSVQLGALGVLYISHTEKVRRDMGDPVSEKTVNYPRQRPNISRKVAGGGF